ncbi:hypothetical protein LBBP_03450 [Leptospira borgpetersenii serovar Ballum]|uniref:Uncharacterized protein n=1 Tax=Leptospira borgpetersenii serovar Ballum TaxID=280505 RepID=A0A0S2IVF3_LEPBO|nr:hypothetical protein LBBP_03450 [Leptospira borgpetersenii serovar Ballum]
MIGIGILNEDKALSQKETKVALLFKDRSAGFGARCKISLHS